MWVRGVIPMPTPPPGLASLPDPYEAKWWPGWLLAWRWTDERRGEWTGYVNFTRPNGLQYLHWIPDMLLRQRSADQVSGDRARTVSPAEDSDSVDEHDDAPGGTRTVASARR